MIYRLVLFLALTAATGLADLDYSFETRAQPRPLHIHVLRLDLTRGHHALDVVFAPDPDGEGPAEAQLETPAALAQQPDIVAAINANAFGVVPPPPANQRSSWRVGLPVDIISWAKNDREERSRPQPAYWCFWLDPAGRAHVGNLTEPVPARLAVAGFGPLIVDGKIVDRSAEPLHPRTAIGTDPTGQTIYMVVVDGRQPGTSEGMSTGELAELMAELGCHAAINLDGGGSSILFHADEAGRLRMANRPSDPGTRPIPLLLVVRKLAPPPPASTIPAP